MQRGRQSDDTFASLSLNLQNALAVGEVGFKAMRTKI